MKQTPIDTVPLLIYGAGGHAKVIINTAKEAQQKVIGVFDDSNSKNSPLETKNLGSYDPLIHDYAKVVIGIGDNALRQKLATKVTHPFGSVYSTHATIAIDAQFAEGCVVFDGAVVQPGVQCGAHVIINTRAGVDHDCRIGSFAQIGPGATLCGNVTVGEGTFICAGATIIQGVTIGRWSVVGAGAVVIRDVPDNVMVLGVPAQIYTSSAS